MDTSALASDGLLPSSGYSLASTSYLSMASGGNVTIGNGLVPPAPTNTPAIATAQSNILIPGSIQSQISGLVNNGDPYGNVIVPTANGYMNVGINGASSPVTSNEINSLLANNTSLTSKLLNSNLQSFTGTDLKIMIECAQNTATSQASLYKVLLECHTLSVSSYRVKNPVRSLGYTNPNGFSRGPRTIAGTMVLTEMSVDVLISFLQGVVIQDQSKNSSITKSDQLPPFNITLVFANEEGAASYRRLIGVEFLNDGTVYSVQDLMVERTISWMALDFTPLLPLDTSSLFKHNVNNAQTITAEQTPADLMNKSISQMSF